MPGRHPHALVRSAAAAVLAVVAVLAVATVSACGDGDAPAPPARTLTPDSHESYGKRGSSSAPPVASSTVPGGSSATTPSASPAAGAATPVPTSTRVADKTIKAHILARIAREPGLLGFEIRVVVRDGTVYLRGRVRTNAQRTLLEQIALTEPGVKKVISAIDVDDAAGY